MSDVDKAAVTQAENVAEKPRKRGCLGHCAKFWWAYLIAVVVVVVVVVPCVLLVAVPKIAQDKVDEAELVVKRITVSNTKTSSLSMSIDTEILTDGSVHATIDGFPGVMYLEDDPEQKPFARINFPETTSDAYQSVKVTQDLEIDDLAALTKFNSWLLTNETLRVTVLGETNVHVKGIARSYGVTFKKTVTMPGMRLLDGTVVNQTRVAIMPDSNGNNFWGKVYIPNRSNFDIELGNTTFHNYLLGQEIGTVFVDNLSLKSGWDNVFDMRASIEKLDAVLGALGQEPYCSEAKGVLPFQLRGKTVVNNGQELPYFADALGSANQTIPIDIATPLNATMNGKYELSCGKH
ncbi:hypothetical protein VTK26DRAFT_1808 [Humicola hyalothermophila]